MRVSRSAFGIATAGLIVLASASACSSGSSSSGTSSAASSSAGGSSSAAAAPSGGTSAPASASPVTVGFHNLEGGSISLPDVRQGFEAGMDYVNSQLGGINGHPMKAVECKTDGTPEASINCANQFVQDKVVLAVQGVDFGADAMLPVLKSAGLAEFGAFSATPGMNSAMGTAYFVAASSQEGYAADVVQQKALGAKSIAVVMVDNAASRASFNGIIAPAAQKVGVQVKAYYYPAQANWTTLSATILTAKPDAVTLWTDAPNGLSAITALRSTGFTGPITAGANTEIIQQLSPSVLKGVNFTFQMYPTGLASYPSAVQGDIAAFNEYIKKDASHVLSMSQAQQGFYNAVMAADVLRQIHGSPLTAKEVYAGLHSVKGNREIFRTTGYNCASPTWPGTTACGSGELYATPNASKVLTVLPNQPVDIASVRPSS
jgi:branched-chain amino acid transport system substrate-binding protein